MHFKHFEDLSAHMQRIKIQKRIQKLGGVTTILSYVISIIVEFQGTFLHNLSPNIKVISGRRGDSVSNKVVLAELGKLSV